MTTSPKTLRLLMPQWQGGNNPTYRLGARLLAWLAPEGDAEFAEVPVAQPDGSKLPVEEGIVAKTAILGQNRTALEIIRKADPDRIVTFGGDCSVSLAPFSYLATKYAGDVAVLWIDSHVDLTSSQFYENAHGYPMRNLLGQGDAEFAAFTETPIPGNRLVYVGVGKDRMSEGSLRDIDAMGARVFDPSELTGNFAEVIDWLKACGASKLLVHFDLDVLDPEHFRAQLFNNPDGLADHFVGMATGKLTFANVIDLLGRSAEVIDIVALSITEHLPWDAENLRQALARLPILSR
ncbi:arginase family protein [Aminobacter sp. MSH1]|uniref:arginase family protein n=1 Tax=Aminobacter sp. MSH1 TaxID=374606 RepID=UPI000D3A9FD0|nr:arginase family protein [Aminobacter sp. MSH1]